MSGIAYGVNSLLEEYLMNCSRKKLDYLHGQLVSHVLYNTPRSFSGELVSNADEKELFFVDLLGRSI